MASSGASKALPLNVTSACAERQETGERLQQRRLLGRVAHEELLEDEFASFDEAPHADQESIRAGAARQAGSLGIQERQGLDRQLAQARIGRPGGQHVQRRLEPDPGVAVEIVRREALLVHERLAERGGKACTLQHRADTILLGRVAAPGGLLPPS